MKKENTLVLVFGAVFVFSLLMIVSNGFRATGHVTEDTTISNVTINVYFSFQMSDNLTEGIQFGDVSSLPAANLNGSHNYDGASSGTTYYLNVSDDSNSAVDFCLKADALNTSTGDEIGLDNETYYHNASTDINYPDLANEVSFTTSYVKASQSVAAGAQSYYRFWLDVPAATPTGTYNNTVSFKAIIAGGSC